MAAYDDPNVQRHKLRITLRKQREAAHFTQREAAHALDWSLSKLIRIEAGAQGISVTDLKAALSLYGVTKEETVADLLTAARGNRAQSWWHSYRDIVSPQFAQYLGHEGIASSFRIHHPFLVPGLLHTQPYAESLLVALQDPERAARIVELRTKRQERLFTDPDLDFAFILAEEALHRWIGGPDCMRDQLEHLLDFAERPNVTLQIVPFNAGAHPGVGGPFIMLHSDETDEDVIFIESGSGDQLIRENPKHTERYESYYSQLGKLAHAPEQGRDLLRQLIDRLHHASESATADLSEQ